MISKVALKRLKEQELVLKMIDIYCRKNHKTPKGKLCDECNELRLYAIKKVENCPLIETKTFCANCEIHCYSDKMRAKIHKVMRFSGKWMMLYHPVTVIRHHYHQHKEKR